MRCLYCGKELALFKRFTSGGEFCSDAHRQQYQDEYNQLALNRLLQAKPPAEAKPEAPSKPESKKAVQEPARTPAPAPTPVMVAAPVASPPPLAPAPVTPPAAIATRVLVAAEEEPAPSPVEAEVEEESAPADAAGFFLEFPVPAVAELMAMAPPELELEYSNPPAVPLRDFEEWGTQLVLAGRLVMHPTVAVFDSAGRTMDRRLEVREFVRGGPLVEVDLPHATETALPEAKYEPMEISAVRYPPQEAASLWQEPASEFTAFQTELGDFARVPFETTGFEESETGNTAAIATEPVMALAPEPIPASPVVSAAQNAPAAATTSSVLHPIFPEAVQSAIPPAVEKQPEPVPELIIKPMPVTLLGVAAGKGKPVPVFTAGLAGSVDVQVPRSSALPLRPVMILEAGPAPAKVEEPKAEEKRTIVVKADARKPQSGRQDPRFANSKVRKQEARAVEPEAKAPEKKKEVTVTAPEIKAAEVAAPPVEKVIETTIDQPAPEPKQEIQPVPTPEPPREAKPSPAGSYAAPDLGLPSLTLQTSGGFLGKLPVPARIAAAAMAVLLIGGVIYLSTKSGSADAAVNKSRVVEAPALPAGDSGWITDWGAEPGVRRTHDISVLAASMSLTDYRMEFQAQIENKALGWIYRARDGKNYYVSKLEIVKPGLDPAVALIRFAVINGEEQPRSQFPLTIPVHLDTLYNIRFDAVGDHFTTYVQDQKVDDFTDDRIKTGGVGLYNEHGEKLGLKGPVRVVPLMIKK